MYSQNYQEYISKVKHCVEKSQYDEEDEEAEAEGEGDGLDEDEDDLQATGIVVDRTVFDPTQNDQSDAAVSAVSQYDIEAIAAQLNVEEQKQEESDEDEGTMDVD